MKPSPLKLEQYFVTELHFAVNPAFDTTKPAQLSDEHLVVDVSLRPDQSAPERWQVSLRVKYQLFATSNAPYSFTLEIVGLFQVSAAYTYDKEFLVKTNGPSVLYAVARETIRQLTCSGPFPGVLIPSVSFYELPPETSTVTPTQTAETKPQ
jgi:preprotein translocase subunit SecB